jgi:metallo-beta-lactamase family protein
MLLDGEKNVKLFGEEIRVAAHIENIEGISGHADRDMLLGWLGNLKNRPQMVYVNHGEDAVTDLFAKTITEKLNFPAEAPYAGGKYDLIKNICLERGNTVRVTKRAAREEESPVYRRLVLAGQRLFAAISANGRARNKDLAKFTDQFVSLAEKWSGNLHSALYCFKNRPAAYTQPVISLLSDHPGFRQYRQKN